MHLLRAFWATATASFGVNLKHYAVYLKNTAIRLLNVPAQVAALYYLWKVILADGNAGTSPDRMLGYYSFAFLIRWLFGVRTVTDRYEKAIYEGDLVNALVRPMPFAALELGRLAAQCAVNLGLLVLFVVPVGLRLGWVEPAAPSLVGFVLLLLAGSLVQFLVYALIGQASFWLEKVFGLAYGFDLVMLLATGALLPLDLYPASIAGMLQALPFRFFVYAPVQALQSPVTWQWVGGELAVSMVWAVLLGLVSALVWRAGMRRFTGQGV